VSKETYMALPGVEWVNGQPVPESRELELSASEARFDIEQGRIHLHQAPAEPVADDPPVSAATSAKRR
jgi:hypothetical protein